MLLILIVFAATGSGTMILRKTLFDLLEISSGTHILFRIVMYVVVMLPGYFLLLIVFGSLAGQFRFFSFFIRKSLFFFMPDKKMKRSSENTKEEPRKN